MNVENGWNASASAWTSGVDAGDPNRTLLLDPVMIRLLGDVKAQKILDIGCGEARFCRMLKERGAETVGIEPTLELLETARTRDPEGTYIEGVAERMPFDDESFDIAISYITLVDIPDFRAAIREMARVLKPCGKLLIANLQSFATTRPKPYYRHPETGERMHVAVEDYFMEKGQLVSWATADGAQMDVVNYHRPLGAYMSALLGCGMRLEAFEEPRPSEEAMKADPRLEIQRKVPLFVVMKWAKA